MPLSTVAAHLWTVQDSSALAPIRCCVGYAHPWGGSDCSVRPGLREACCCGRSARRHTCGRCSVSSRCFCTLSLPLAEFGARPAANGSSSKACSRSRSRDASPAVATSADECPDRCPCGWVLHFCERDQSWSGERRSTWRRGRGAGLASATRAGKRLTSGYLSGCSIDSTARSMSRLGQQRWFSCASVTSKR